MQAQWSFEEAAGLLTICIQPITKPVTEPVI